MQFLTIRSLGHEVRSFRKHVLYYHHSSPYHLPIADTLKYSLN
jgi:hypothetical protein